MVEQFKEFKNVEGGLSHIDLLRVESVSDNKGSNCVFVHMQSGTQHNLKDTTRAKVLEAISLFKGKPGLSRAEMKEEKSRIRKEKGLMY